MTTNRMRGVPRAMRQDGWWLADIGTDGDAARAAKRRRDGLKPVLLVCLIALADVLVWDVAPGLNIAVLGAAVAAAGLAMAWPGLGVRNRIGFAAGTALALLPLVELVQPLSIMIALAGALVGCVALAGVQRAEMLRGALRLLWIGPAQSVADVTKAARRAGRLDWAGADPRALLMGWALPLLASLTFLALLVGANPLLDRWLQDIARFDVPLPDAGRMWFWGALALLIWPVLVARRMHERLRHRAPLRATVQRPGLVNAQSVARSLVAFNALFAVQTVMDILFLYADAALPGGISPAAYAHRGAYPLVAAALLAGLFAVVSRPYLKGRPLLRAMMLVWLGQTMALVVASVWRLDLYVEAYGLTRLRLAAFVWMGLVAAGLGIVVVQIWRDRPAAWMMWRSGLLGAVVLYACAFVSFDGMIARHNMNAGVKRDSLYLCGLSEGVIPGMRRALGPAWRESCVSRYRVPRLHHPADWREWGFRNWRVRRSLAAMNAKTTETAAP